MPGYARHLYLRFIIFAVLRCSNGIAHGLYWYIKMLPSTKFPATAQFTQKRVADLVNVIGTLPKTYRAWYLFIILYRLAKDLNEAFVFSLRASRRMEVWGCTPELQIEHEWCL